MERATPVGRLRLELGVRRLRDLLDRARELLAQSSNCRALLLALRLDPLGVRDKPRLDLHDQLALCHRNARDLRGELFLDPVEVLRPLDEASLDLLLRRVERRGELVTHRRFAAGKRTAVLLADPALLLGELRDRFGARARERTLELLRAVGRLLLDHRSDPLLRPRVVGVELLTAPHQP